MIAERRAEDAQTKKKKRTRETTEKTTEREEEREKEKEEQEDKDSEMILVPRLPHQEKKPEGNPQKTKTAKKKKI